MAEFSFAQTDEAREFCERVKAALVTFGQKSEDDAISLVSRFYGEMCRLTNLEDDPFVYREPPYYDAMCILHHPVLGDGKNFWWKDPQLWPPPTGWEGLD